MTYTQCPYCYKTFSTVGIRMHMQKCTGQPVTFKDGKSASIKMKEEKG